ncbi:MAG: hypothetical protein PVH61_38020 [Candidatus Aminicenantes bacterium]|jgi:hypothetical protein
MPDIEEAGESYEYADHRVELIPTGKYQKPFKILINDVELQYDIDKTSKRILSHFFYYSFEDLKEYIKSFIDAYSGHIEEVINSMNHH